MSIKSTFTLLTIVLFVTSCGHAYKEYDKESFPTYSWKSGQEIVFNPTIEDVSKSYDLILGIRHLYGFQLGEMTMTVKSVSPSGKESVKEYDFQIKNPDGGYIGKCGGDLCDLETRVDENIKFDEPGQYKYIITHNVAVDRIPGVMELGLIIDVQE